MAPAGLTVGQFGMLARLYGDNARREVVPIGTLAERMGMDPTTLSRSLKPFLGLIDNAVNPKDRRRRAVNYRDGNYEAAPSGTFVARGSAANR